MEKPFIYSYEFMTTRPRQSTRHGGISHNSTYGRICHGH